MLSGIRSANGRHLSAIDNLDLGMLNVGYRTSCSVLALAKDQLMSQQEDRAAAIQHLIWALEHIERLGNEKAASLARLALKALNRLQKGVEETAK